MHTTRVVRGSMWIATGVLLGVLAGGVGADTTEANVTWIGDDPGNPGWALPTNWREAGTGDNKAPAVPTTSGTLLYGTNGMAVTGVVDVDRQVGRITFGGVRYDPAITHTIDLNGKTLTVAGTIARTQWETQTLNITNGTLRIGTASSAGNINLGQDYGTGTLTIRPGAVLDTFNLNSITLGYTQWSPNGRGYLDLRGAKIAGGVLAATNLYLRTGHSRNSRLYLDQNTDISRIEIARDLEICRTSGPGSSYIGNPTDEQLPPNVSFKVGVSPSERGNITFSRISFVGYGNVNGKLVASGGGSFEGWLNEMHIVRYEAGSANGDNRQSGAHVGTFDISRMNSCLIDVQTLKVGTDHYIHPPLDQDNLQATLALCPGVVTAGTVVVGSTIGSGWGRVSLSNTTFIVTNSLTLNKTAQVTINVGDTSSGIELTTGAFTFDPGATITVTFHAPPAGAGLHYGLRIAGDHAAALSALAGLTINSTGLAGKEAEIFVSQGATYVGIPPPGGMLFLLR